MIWRIPKFQLQCWYKETDNPALQEKRRADTGRQITRTVAGQAGKPLTLASTRSPTFHCRRDAGTAEFFLPAFLRAGAMAKIACGPFPSPNSPALAAAAAAASDHHFAPNKNQHRTNRLPGIEKKQGIKGRRATELAGIGGRLDDRSGLGEGAYSCTCKKLWHWKGVGGQGWGGLPISVALHDVGGEGVWPVGPPSLRSGSVRSFQRCQ